ncbi:MAG: acyl-CoA/acyl-ACP dehydrogenase [Planctomycetes bacterium]|nr:acyl-CoA/acyl-ACP dehydrogenase [Planctomycetota bacterium]
MNPIQRNALLADVDTFCQQLRPHEELCYLEHRRNDQLVATAAKFNLLGMPIPTEYGGRGADAETYALCLARIGREGTGVRTFFSGHTSIGQYPVWKFGSAETKQRYLPPSVQGKCVMAFGLTEPDAGSNPLEMTTTYRREKDGFRISGVKYLISNGAVADAVIVFGYPEGTSGAERRMSAFVVDTSGATFESEDLPAKCGMYTANTGMFQMDDHPVPAANLLGQEGEGFRVAMKTLVSGRLSVASGCVGVIEDCLEEALNYSRQRQQHGKPIGKHQLVQEHLAEIHVAQTISRAVVAQAAAAKQAADEQPDNKELQEQADLIVAEAKLIAARAACDAADRAVQVFGGRGWSELYRVGRHWQDVRVCRIYEGTDEILKLKLAAAMLGKDFAAFH